MVDFTGLPNAPPSGCISSTSSFEPNLVWLEHWGHLHWGLIWGENIIVNDSPAQHPCRSGEQALGDAQGPHAIIKLQTQIYNTQSSFMSHIHNLTKCVATSMAYSGSWMRWQWQPQVIMSGWNWEEEGKEVFVGPYSEIGDDDSWSICAFAYSCCTVMLVLSACPIVQLMYFETHLSSIY